MLHIYACQHVLQTNEMVNDFLHCLHEASSENPIEGPKPHIDGESK